MTKKPEAFPSWTFDKHCPKMQWNEVSNVQFFPTVENNLDDVDLELFGIFVGAAATSTSASSPSSPSPASASASSSSSSPNLSSVLMDGYNYDGSCDPLSNVPGLLTMLQEVLDENIKAMGKLGTVTPTLRLLMGTKTKRYALLSLGPKPDAHALAVSGGGGTGSQGDGGVAEGLQLGKAIASLCSGTEKSVATLCLHLPTNVPPHDSKIFLRVVSTGFYEQMYVDNRYRTGDNIAKTPDLKEFRMNRSQDQDPNAAADAWNEGRLVAQGVILSRDIVNAPHNVLNSESLAETAQRIAAESDNTIQCIILGKSECESRGMGAYLGVARGSETEPQFIHLSYKPADGVVKKKVGVVGKGLLFDTGGYNIKTSMMELMKFDCGGAAAVLGAAWVIGALKPPGVEAHFIVAACENMINDRAMVPSDILTASNGKTIEIMNTDAEGRLTLADALVYADKEVGCESIVELSTLTGACMVSLGKEVCGLWTHDDALAKEIADVSQTTGDRSWRMPLVKEYNEQLKSNIADLKNLGTPYGGSITAALFLQNFVDNKPYAHLDIAGPVWSEKTGATGFGAKLIVEWISRQGQ